MKTNLNNFDRIMRVLFSIFIVVLYYFSVISGPLAVFSIAIAAYFMITSSLSICPIYLSLDVSSQELE